MSSFYITTPIYYVNDLPHIGHTYSTVVADVLARYHRLAGNEVFFLTGTDEHGQKVEKAAKNRGLNPKEHVDRMVKPFQELWQRFAITNNDFIRTTEPRHEEVVKKIFSRLFNQGDIYKGIYEGWYCVHEETFWPESQLINRRCPECNREVEWVQEDSYFFRVQKYKEDLIAYIEANPEFIFPEVRRNEVLSMLKSGVTDVAVSRTAFKWGVPVPFDSRHVVYVWFDALINYLTGIGYLQNEALFHKFWPPVHVIGKDILKFHAIIWPAMLLALEVPLPKKIIATGFWTLGEQKISKSRGKVINPHELADEFGVDAVRYFLVREIPLGQDGEFSRQALIRRLNADLANDLGNLLHRTIPMLEKYCQAVVPPKPASFSLAVPLVKKVEEVCFAFQQKMANFAIREALIDVWQILATANKFIDSTEPWRLAKEKKTTSLNEVMWSLAETLRLTALLIAPVMPQTATAISQQLGISDKLDELKYNTCLSWGVFAGGTGVQKGKPLFPRFDSV